MTAGSSHRYVFRATWRLAAPVDDVYAVLADPESYPAWWPQVRSVVRIGSDAGVMRVRSLLPYDLVVSGTRELEDPIRRVLRARLEGDISGWSGWAISATGAGTVAVFDEDVVVHKPLLRALSHVVRPALTWNHALMMRSGERHLRRYLAAPAPVTALAPAPAAGPAPFADHGVSDAVTP
jgi:hypothetical protein